MPKGPKMTKMHPFHSTPLHCIPSTPFHCTPLQCIPSIHRLHSTPSIGRVLCCRVMCCFVDSVIVAGGICDRGGCSSGLFVFNVLSARREVGRRDLHCSVAYGSHSSSQLWRYRKTTNTLPLLSLRTGRFPSHR